MKIKYEITKDQYFCSFGDGVVYEFVSADNVPFTLPCETCSFRYFDDLKKTSVRCCMVPCQKGHRTDKKDGFWRISETVDYELFAKLDRVGG